MAEGVDLNSLPRATLVPGRRARISAVWIIPILAAIVGLGIAVQRILSEGPTITIVFKAAEGIEAGKTFVKYKDVNIGQVVAVQLSPDYSKVEVTARIAKSAAGLIVEDAKFWVVRPRITLRGISDLGTLLSGNFIGFDAGSSGKAQRRFSGLEVPPIITGAQPGRQFVLKANDLGSLEIGSPVYYRHLLAGQVVAVDLAADGSSVELKVFVEAPYDKYVSAGTRFWNVSGLDVSVGAGGVEVHTQSLAALIEGGLAFDTPSFLARAEPAAANTGFTLYGDQSTAMKQPESVVRHYVLYFTESLHGLSVGAPVTVLGLPAGEVTEVGLDIDPATLNVRGRVEITAFPERLFGRLSSSQHALATSMDESASKRRVFLQRLVEERGLRAQLRLSSLLTGQRYVAFDYHPKAAKVRVDWNKEILEMPVVPSTLPDVETKLTSILAKVDKLPLEAIGTDLKQDLETLDRTLKGVGKLVSHIDDELVPGVKTTLEDARRTLTVAERLMQDADTTLVGPNAPAQQQLRDALKEVAQSARALRVLADDLERHPEALIRGKSEQKSGRK
jgi:paraquat-inducible protein B